MGVECAIIISARYSVLVCGDNGKYPSDVIQANSKRASIYSSELIASLRIFNRIESVASSRICFI